MYYDFNGNMTSTTREELSKITVDPLTLIPHFGMFVPGQDVEGEDALEMYYASYTYNKFNEMVEARTGDATSKYQYNAEGYRTVTEVNGNKTYYVYIYDKVALEVSDNQFTVTKNIYGNGKLVTRMTEDDSYYYYYNGHGDTVAIQDMATDSTVATYNYDVYGNPTEDSDIDFDNNYLFSGYQYDQETGLYYLNSRMYDPEIARFMQQDIYLGQGSDPLSLNLYSYVSNNPIRYYDPTGHILTEWDKANLSASDQQAILDATTDWESGDATQRAEAAAIAAAIRASVYGTTSAVETQASDGYTYIQYKEDDSLLNGWDLEEVVNNPKPYEPKLTTSGITISSMKGTDVVSYGDVRVGTDIPISVRQRIETAQVGEEIDEGTNTTISSWVLFTINQALSQINFTFDPVKNEYVSIETSYVKSSDDLLNIVPGGQTPNGYTLTKHAADTINDSSRFNGTFSLDQIDDFILNPEIKVLDTKTNNVNLFKMTDYSTSSYTRVTIPFDGGQRIISTGFDGINSVTNKISNGRYIIVD